MTRNGWKEGGDGEEEEELEDWNLWKTRDSWKEGRNGGETG